MLEKSVMKFLITILLMPLLCVSALSSESQQGMPEFFVRGGTPNFVEKAERGAEVNIAYLGGSITSQPGYRVLSRKWFQKRYPKARINDIHAAIGGTGSELGVFRFDQDVLAHNPDLLFVEFAVNDYNTDEEVITRSFEGIIRKTWKANPKTDICFVYTLTHLMLPDLQSGKYQKSAVVMEKVADHYGIPSVHMGMKIADMVEEGTLVMKGEKGGMTAVSGSSLDKGPGKGKSVMVFSRNGVHPYTDTGHVLYMEAIERAMAKIIPAGKAGKHVLPSPISEDHHERASLVPLSDITGKKGFQKMPKDKGPGKHFRRQMPDMWMASEEGACLEFKFKGDYLGFYDLLGPDCGKIQVEVDGVKKLYKRMDGYSKYNRLSMLVVSRALNDGLHHVKVTLLGDQLDKEKILFERNREDFKKNPKKYQPHRWYVGGVLIRGSMVDF